MMPYTIASIRTLKTELTCLPLDILNYLRQCNKRMLSGDKNLVMRTANMEEITIDKRKYPLTIIKCFWPNSANNNIYSLFYEWEDYAVLTEESRPNDYTMIFCFGKFSFILLLFINRNRCMFKISKKSFYIR